MPILLNEQSAALTSGGNLTLGLGGVVDPTADTTQGYAKADYFVEVNLQTLLPIAGSNIAYALTRAAAGLYGLAVTASGAVTPKIGLFIPVPHRALAAINSAAANNALPKGYKLQDLILAYTVATADATSVTVVFSTELQANNTSRAAASTTPLGAVTFENPPGTVAATLPVAQQANPYVCRIVPATPVFITGGAYATATGGSSWGQTQLTAEIQLSLPNTSVLTITEVIARFSAAWY